MKSRDIDLNYQAAVDRLAAVYVTMSREELFRIPDYGAVEMEVFGKPQGAGYWNWKFSEDDNRLVFITERKLFLLGSRKFISGVLYGRTVGPRRLSDVECGEYD